MHLPIRSRLTAWYVVVLATILLAWAAFLFLRLEADLYAGIDQTLELRAAQIATGFRGAGEGEFQDVAQTPLAGLPRSDSAAQLISARGKILESSGNAVAERRMVPVRALQQALRGRRLFETSVLGARAPERFRVLVMRLPSRPGVVLAVASSTKTADDSLRHLLVLLLVSVPIALGAAGAGGWRLARKALDPVAKMTSKASEIGLGRLNERVDVPRVVDELGRLALTLNAMLDRLEDGVEEKRRFIADASHELRTPLAVMRSELEVSLESGDLQPETAELLVSNLEEVDRMSRIIENLLTLARIDEGRLELLRRPVHLRRLAQDVVSRMRVLSEAGGVKVSVKGPELEVEADPEYLQQVVANLVENAVKYSRRGGLVTIETWRAGEETGLSVVDTGPGISEDVLPRVFDRFFRVDKARSRAEGGSGLGLSISKEIVQAHKGRIWATSEPGKGSSFTVALPNAA